MSNRKILKGFVRLWKHVPPVWELPMGEFLAFYDIDLVTVRVMWHKPPHKTTEEIKLIGLEETNLDACVNEAQRERIVITRNGKPVALVVGIQGS